MPPTGRQIDMRTQRMVVTLTALAVVALLGACEHDDGEAAGTPPPSSPSATPDPMPSVSPPVVPVPPQPTVVPPPTAAPGPSITGRVIEGVEAGCLLLRTPSGDYLLIATPAMRDRLQVSATATVRGYADPNMMTTCQQGTPFVVQEVVSS